MPFSALTSTALLHSDRDTFSIRGPACAKLGLTLPSWTSVGASAAHERLPPEQGAGLCTGWTERQPPLSRSRGGGQPGDRAGAHSVDPGVTCTSEGMQWGRGREAAFFLTQQLPGIWGCRVSGLPHLRVTTPP